MKQMFDTNVVGLSICAREAVKSMKAHNVTLGHIINVNRYRKHKTIILNPLAYNKKK
jgi:NADP-dependent 3-hydroxy acid dehydrogenase YdfG